MAYVEVTPKTDVWAVQKEIQWRLTPSYHHDGVDVNADPKSITVTSVGKIKAYLCKIDITLKTFVVKLPYGIW